MTLVSANIQLRKVSHGLWHSDVHLGLFNFTKQVKWKNDDDILLLRTEAEVFNYSKCTWVLLYVVFSWEYKISMHFRVLASPVNFFYKTDYPIGLSTAIQKQINYQSALINNFASEHRY